MERLSGEGMSVVARSRREGGRVSACRTLRSSGAAYEALQKWMEANGHVPSGVAYEFYLNDPQTTPASELQTRVVFPLR